MPAARSSEFSKSERMLRFGIVQFAAQLALHYVDVMSKPDRSMPAIFVSLILVGLLAGPPAHASQGFDCRAEDGNLIFSAGGTFSGGPGAGILNFSAKLQLLKKDLPAHLRELNITQDMSFSWLDDEHFNLRFNAEPAAGDFSSTVELIVKTSGNMEAGDIAGRYSLVIFNADNKGKTIKAK